MQITLFADRLDVKMMNGLCPFKSLIVN